ncbi:MAG: UDP-N-acetylmuramoyl-L-alanyl-D-glutamate--2,6-diaminopimelate ligase [Gemmatimonadales bacterium]|nr:UDP-N-acetylmuramoyl-L-alanyl-D-glutamate--2,6-diaminopimelate ligase [Gemmatimonadales bacterium]
MALSLRQICKGIPGLETIGDSDVSIHGVTSDSGQAGPGILFVAVVGTEQDGHQFLDAAVEAGSEAVVVSRSSQDSRRMLNVDGPGALRAWVLAENTRPLPALLARELAGRPDEKLLTAGITGTNGKTTVAFLLQQMLAGLRGPCGLLGTIRYEDGISTQPAPLTTPGGPVFYQWLGKMSTNGCRSVAMEISSHALDQDRTAGLGLDVAVLTNMGRDHLDYHRDTASYLAAKLRILELLHNGRPGVLVVNGDDRLLSDIETGDLDVIRFSVGGSGAAAADLVVKEAKLELAGTKLKVAWRNECLFVDSPLVGRFNVENLTAALAAGIGLGLDPEDCARNLGAVAQVPGRLERFLLPDGALAVVDYAHTHDALAAVLGTCDELASGRLLCVFGCGGDRDQGKRTLMGAVAARCSDLAWVTSDNPRSEDPAAICAQVVEGFSGVENPRAAEVQVIVDRRRAIESALAAAQRGDIVVIAGKGHEDYQLVGNQVLSLDDRVIVGQWIERLGDDG